MQFNFILVTILIINALLALGIFVHNPHRKTNQYYALFVTFLNLFIISVFFENRPDLVGLENINIFLRLDFSAAAVFFYMWFRFCTYFTQSRLLIPTYNWFNKTSSTFLLIIIYFSLFTNLILDDISFYDDVIHFTGGIFWPLYAFLLLFWAAGGILLLLAKRRQSFIEKNKFISQQINIILLGFILSFGIGLFIFLFLQTFFSISLEVSQLGLFSLSILAFLTAYAIVKHQFLDIKIIIQRGLIYTVLLSIITGFYLLLVTILGVLFQRTTDITILFSAGITAITGIFTVPYIERYFRKITDKIFFKDKYDYSQALEELSEILNENLNLEEIFDKTAAKLQELLKTNSTLFISTCNDLSLQRTGVVHNHQRICSQAMIKSIKDKKDILFYNEIDTLIPSAEQTNEDTKALSELKKIGKRHDTVVILPIINGPLFLLFLGKKLSGDPYTSEDFRLLKTFANQASVAINKAELYGRVKGYSQKLEKRVAKRTARIKKLQERQEKMILDISHGMQTPLTIIKGELAELEKHVPDNKKIDTFERSLDKVSKFIYDLLRLAKLETNEDTFKRGSINMSSLVEDMVEYFDILMKGKKITLESDIEPDITIQGDIKKIEEMIINIVSNSVKYMNPDVTKKMIKIGLHSNNDTAILTIADNGIGMTEQQLSHIFERFYRIKDEKRNHTKGTGLGLAITKSIIEKHYGTIAVDSTPDIGTTFTITIPLYGSFSK